MENSKSRAKRFSIVLKNKACDDMCIKKLAIALDYIPGDLQKDIQSLSDYIRELEEEISNYKKI